jgi:hypothetical protein
MDTLTEADLRALQRARETLAEPHGYEPDDLAAQVGALKFHLAELAELVERLAGTS